MLKGINNIMGLPEENISDVIKITVIGNDDINIENYGRLLLYTDNEISVKNDDGIIKIVGNGLKIEAIDKNYIGVRGAFLCISYEN